MRTIPPWKGKEDIFRRAIRAARALHPDGVGEVDEYVRLVQANAHLSMEGRLRKRIVRWREDELRNRHRKVIPEEIPATSGEKGGQQSEGAKPPAKASDMGSLTDELGLLSRLDAYEEELKAAAIRAATENNVENARRKLAGEPLLPDDWVEKRIRELRGEVHKRYPAWIESAAPTEEDRRIAERDRKVHGLHAEGLSDRRIATQLGIPRRVVRKVLRPDEESFFGGGL